ncbi:MAG: MerR family transcriptional regulator [Betaproteobacteria bacterium]|nr:MerR family transcriptional regulator [Betaproteobacteria bacterium]
MESIVPVDRDDGPAITIAAVERDTGLSKDALRMWERRYGFPAPLRDANGERVYPRSQVEKLRLIKRLMDCGHRPGRIMTHTVDELRTLASDAPLAEPCSAALDSSLRLVKAHQVPELQQQLTQMLMKQGLQRFVLETVAPLNRVIGEAWMRGELAVFEEHLYSEQVQAVLRSAVVNLRQPAEAPRVLLTSFPNEEHRLGLLMVEALLSMEGIACISLGNEMPLAEIAQAASAHHADIVALSFSGSFPTPAAVTGMNELRTRLPDSVAIWAGGRSMERVRRPPPGVTVMRSLEEVYDQLQLWRQAHPIS